jgi:opacity protein-like surface antigen
MKRFFSIVIFVAVSVIGVTAHAQQGTGGQSTGFYVGGQAGLNLLSDSDVLVLDRFFGPTTVIAEYDPGFGLGGVLGYDFGHFRADAEIAYRYNSLDGIQGPAETFEGHSSALSYMANAYFDIPVDWPVKPYIGGGVGVATVMVDLDEIGVGNIADESDTVLAYQFSGGVGYDINPKTTLTLGYRYFATDDQEFVDRFGTNTIWEYQSHEINIGVRYLFN